MCNAGGKCEQGTQGKPKGEQGERSGAEHHPADSTMQVHNQFYVVRHGRAQNNEDGVVSCKLETQARYGLTLNGREMVAAEAQHHTDFDAIYASPK